MNAYDETRSFVVKREEAMTRSEYAVHKMHVHASVALALRGVVASGEIEQAYADAWREWPTLPGRVDENKKGDQC